MSEPRLMNLADLAGEAVEEIRQAEGRIKPDRMAKKYRRHHCSRRHRSYRTLAECIWPRAVWVIGSGPWASVAHCRTLTVMLHPSRERAEEALDQIDCTGCGGACSGQHELIELASPEEAEPWE